MSILNMPAFSVVDCGQVFFHNILHQSYDHTSLTYHLCFSFLRVGGEKGSGEHSK